MAPKASRSISGHRSDFACLLLRATDSPFSISKYEPSIACWILRNLSLHFCPCQSSGQWPMDSPLHFDFILIFAERTCCPKEPPKRSDHHCWSTTLRWRCERDDLSLWESFWHRIPIPSRQIIDYLCPQPDWPFFWKHFLRFFRVNAKHPWGQIVSTPVSHSLS